MDLIELKNKQKIKIDDIIKPNCELFEPGEYHDYFRRIPFQKLKHILSKEKIDLNNKFLHVASCGTGIDIYYLNKILKKNIKYFATDYSEVAIIKIKKIFPDILSQVEDNEKLSFADNYFDFSFIANSLHHLPRPIMGLYELLRVSKEGVIVIEPNDCLLIDLSKKIKIAQEYEISGNYVYRFSKRDVDKLSKSIFVNYSLIRFFSINKVAKNRLGFVLFKLINILLNLFIPLERNNILFIIKKTPFKKSNF